MNQSKSLFHVYRFPTEIISLSVWLYHRFCPSFRDVEDLLAERGIIVSYESIHSWCNKFGPAYARAIKTDEDSFGYTWYMGEVYIVTVRGERRYLWRAVDQECLPRERSECCGHGDVLDIIVQKRKDKQAAVRFFKKLRKIRDALPGKSSQTSSPVTERHEKKSFHFNALRRSLCE